ncbi:MAG: hypothetical protein ACP5NX_02510 [Candidatus Bilamarchaeaceae archaeon]
MRIKLCNRDGKTFQERHLPTFRHGYEVIADRLEKRHMRKLAESIEDRDGALRKWISRSMQKAGDGIKETLNKTGIKIYEPNAKRLKYLDKLLERIKAGDDIGPAIPGLTAILAEDDGKWSYGEQDTKKAIKLKAVEALREFSMKGGDINDALPALAWAVHNSGFSYNKGMTPTIHALGVALLNPKNEKKALEILKKGMERNYNHNELRATECLYAVKVASEMGWNPIHILPHMLKTISEARNSYSKELDDKANIDAILARALAEKRTQGQAIEMIRESIRRNEFMVYDFSENISRVLLKAMNEGFDISPFVKDFMEVLGGKYMDDRKKIAADTVWWMTTGSSAKTLAGVLHSRDARMECIKMMIGRINDPGEETPRNVLELITRAVNTYLQEPTAEEITEMETNSAEWITFITELSGLMENVRKKQNSSMNPDGAAVGAHI